MTELSPVTFSLKENSETSNVALFVLIFKYWQDTAWQDL